MTALLQVRDLVKTFGMGEIDESDVWDTVEGDDDGADDGL